MTNPIVSCLIRSDLMIKTLAVVWPTNDLFAKLFDVAYIFLHERNQKMLDHPTQ